MHTENVSQKKPFISHSLGVHPSQIKATLEQVKREGGRFTFNEGGFVVAESKAGHNDALKFFGKVNPDGGFGDYTGK